MGIFRHCHYRHAEDGAFGRSAHAERYSKVMTTTDQRLALRMLARSPFGSNESIILAHGIDIGTLHDLVRNGFATFERRTIPAGQRLIEVKWITITEAGRLALTE